MACSAHRFHVPPQPASDSHHVICRAWQKLHAVSVGLQVRAVDGLWDRRTVELCPNDHRRVHEAIVKMMRAGTTNDPLEARKAAFGTKRLNRVESIALLGLDRFVEAGGSLDALRTAGLYGEQ